MLNRHYASTEFITGLRAIAMMMVFIVHSGGGGISTMLSSGARVVELGKYGVDIFFVISGFTIFYQFYKRDYLLKDFLLVRLARISIPYFPILITLYILTSYGVDFNNHWAIKFNNGEISIVNLLLHLFYIPYIDVKYATSIIGVEWTLSIEVFYYFLLGYMITRIKNFIDIKKLIIYLVIFFTISLSVIFITKIYSSAENILLSAWLPFKYGYMFLLGGMAYHIREKIIQKYDLLVLNKISNIAISISFFLFLWFLTDKNIPTIGPLNELFFSLLTFVLIISVNDNSFFSKMFNNKIVLFFGSISFSFYLLHILILNIPILKISIENVTINFMYYLILTLVISTVYYLFLEVKLYSCIKGVILKREVN